MVIPYVGIWWRRKTRPGGCTDSKSAYNRNGLSPNVRRSSEPDKIVYGKIAGQCCGDSECQRDDGAKKRRLEQCEYRLADHQEKDARRHAKCDGAKNSRASIFGKEPNEEADKTRQRIDRRVVEKPAEGAETGSAEKDG
jgi:hypothetical protein